MEIEKETKTKTKGKLSDIPIVEDEIFKAFIDSQSSDETQKKYRASMTLFLQYLASRNLPHTCAEIKDQRFQDIKSDNQDIKFRYETLLKQFYKFLYTDYIGKRGKPLSKSSASATTIAIRGFFKFIRSKLEMQKGDISQPTEGKGFHDFSLDELQLMFRQANGKQRAILCAGICFGAGAEDFVRILRRPIEEKIALVEKGVKEYPIRIDWIRRKTGADACTHLSGEACDSLRDYWRTVEPKEVVYEEKGDPNIPYGTKVVFAFPNGNGNHITEKVLNDELKRMWKQAFGKIKPSGRIVWHRLRAFLISQCANARLSEPTIKYMTGKVISPDMKTYLTGTKMKEAFHQVQPLISMTGITNKRAKRLDVVEEELQELRGAMRVIAKYVAKALKSEIGARPDTTYRKKFRPEETTELDEDIKFLEDFAEKGKKKPKVNAKKLIEENNNDKEEKEERA